MAVQFIALEDIARIKVLGITLLALHLGFGGFDRDDGDSRAW